jgi:hypothetical protein
MSFEPQARVSLPGDVERILTVFVNSITQVEGTDYRRDGDHLEFAAALRREGKLGFWRWLSIFIGIAGTYRQDDSVDVLYVRDGKRVLVSKLDIESLVEGDSRAAISPDADAA